MPQPSSASNAPGARRRPLPTALAISLLLTACVLFLGVEVVRRGPIVHADVAIAGLLYGLRTPWLDDVMMAVSALGDGSQRTVVTVLVALYLLWRRRWRWALVVVLAMVGAAIATPAFKTLFHVARPSALYAGADAFSFPSGHASSAAALYLTLAWMGARSLPRRQRLLIWTPAVAIVLATMVSRVYVGAHWPSDVVAGAMLGAALASLAITVAAAAPPPSPAMRPAWDGPAFVAALVLTAVLLGPTAFAKAQRLYAPYLRAGPTPREAISPQSAP